MKENKEASKEQEAITPDNEKKPVESIKDNFPTFPKAYASLGEVYMCSNGVFFAPDKQKEAERYAQDNKLELRKITP